jgi:hypothetical protein
LNISTVFSGALEQLTTCGARAANQVYRKSKVFDSYIDIFSTWTKPAPHCHEFLTRCCRPRDLFPPQLVKGVWLATLHRPGCCTTNWFDLVRGSFRIPPRSVFRDLQTSCSSTSFLIFSTRPLPSLETVLLVCTTTRIPFTAHFSPFYFKLESCWESKGYLLVSGRAACRPHPLYFFHQCAGIELLHHPNSKTISCQPVPMSQWSKRILRLWA